MTMREALQATNNILGGISVPMALKEQIADPLSLAIGNINELIKALDNAMPPKAEEPAETGAPDAPAVTEDQI